MSAGQYRLVAPSSEPPPKQQVEIDDANMSAEAFGKAVHVQHGKVRIVVPWVVVAALITAVGTYYGAHSAQQATPPNDAVLSELRQFKADSAATAQDQKLQNALIIQRVGTLETQNGTTQAQLSTIITALRVPSTNQGASPVTQAQLSAIIAALRQK